MKGIGFLVCGLSAALMVSLLYAVAGVTFYGAPYASVLVPLTTWGLPIIVIFGAAFVAIRPSLRAIAVLNVLTIVAIGGAVLWPVYALAQEAGGTTINAGALFGDARSTIEAVVGGVIGVAVIFITYLVKKYTGVSIDAKYRDALQSVLTNGAHVALDRAQTSADTIDLDLKSAAVVHLVEHARVFAPLAVKHFKLDDRALGELARAQLAKLLPVAAIDKPPAPATI